MNIFFPTSIFYWRQVCFKHYQTLYVGTSPCKDSIFGSLFYGGLAPSITPNTHWLFGIFKLSHLKCDIFDASKCFFFLKNLVFKNENKIFMESPLKFILKKKLKNPFQKLVSLTHTVDDRIMPYKNSIHATSPS